MPSFYEVAPGVFESDDITIPVTHTVVNPILGPVLWEEPFGMEVLKPASRLVDLPEPLLEQNKWVQPDRFVAEIASLIPGRDDVVEAAEYIVQRVKKEAEMPPYKRCEHIA